MTYELRIALALLFLLLVMLGLTYRFIVLRIRDLEREMKYVRSTPNVSAKQDFPNIEIISQTRAIISEISETLRNMNETNLGTERQLMRFQEMSQDSMQTLQAILREFQRPIEAMGKNLEMLNEAIKELPSRMEVHAAAPAKKSEMGAELPRRAVSRGSDPLEEFVTTYQEQIRQASSKGIDAVRSLLTDFDNSLALEVDAPTDKMFIIANLGSAQTTGKAYVLAGKYLGRPWVEWFNLPKGVNERIEATIEPATVIRERNGEWKVIRKGNVLQG